MDDSLQETFKTNRKFYKLGLGVGDSSAIALGHGFISVCITALVVAVPINSSTTCLVSPSNT